MIMKKAGKDLQNTKSVLQAVLAFIKVGIIGFGGGSALIPVIEKELVQKEKVISSEEYTKHTIIANITPGTLPTKLAALSRTDISVVSAYAYTFPSIILLLAFLSLLSIIGDKGVDYIEYASVGISTFIIFLLVEYITKVMKNGKLENHGKKYIVIMLAAFLVTGGKELRCVLSGLTGCEKKWLLDPILDISTINLMIVSFFVILFLGTNSSYKKKVVACILAGLFVLSVGKKQIFPVDWNMKLVIEVAMVVAIIATVIYEFRKKKDCVSKVDIQTKENTGKYKKTLRNIGIFILLSVIAFGITLICSVNKTNTSSLNIIDYTVNSAISTITSFGGGEAFISIAEGMFVNTGYVDSGIYYSQIVSIANALPGPILVKIIAAVGFEFGKLSFNSPFLGIMIAVLGSCVAIGVSSVVALVVYLGFDKLKNAPRVQQIQNYILPVVCGMLISTCLSMLYEAQKIFIKHYGKMAVYPGTIVVIGIFALVIALNKKLKWSDIKILLSVAAITESLFLVCGLITR